MGGRPDHDARPPRGPARPRRRRRRPRFARAFAKVKLARLRGPHPHGDLEHLGRPRLQLDQRLEGRADGEDRRRGAGGLLRILLGQLEPQKGKVRFGTNLEVSYYDQLRQQLDEEKTVIENVCPGGDTVTINGKPRHIIGYLQDFLFTPDRARTPVKVLSGGERNRLFLARLFTKPSNFLVMDEPTNDLDIETQELLEELLMEYSGTLLLVSHDRSFLNNVVTSTMVMEGEGQISEFAGGYDDWLSQRPVKTPNIKPKITSVQQKPNPIKPLILRKLSFKEERELEGLPAKIEKMESEQEEIFVLLADINFYQRDPQEIARVNARLEGLAQELLEAYQRWEYLEASKKENP